jgi:hypothetical protein
VVSNAVANIFDLQYLCLNVGTLPVDAGQMSEYGLKRVFAMPNHRIVFSVKKRTPESKCHLSHNIIMHRLSFVLALQFEKDFIDFFRILVRNDGMMRRVHEPIGTIILLEDLI